MLELFRELLPKVVTVAVIANPNCPDFERAVNEPLEPARAMGLAAHLFKTANEQEIASAFAAVNACACDVEDPSHFCEAPEAVLPGSARILTRASPGCE